LFEPELLEEELSSDARRVVVVERVDCGDVVGLLTLDDVVSLRVVDVLP